MALLSVYNLILFRLAWLEQGDYEANEGGVFVLEEAYGLYDSIMHLQSYLAF
jgi:hypothetical protein